MQTLQSLIERKSFTGGNAAMGATVTAHGGARLVREVVGVIVDIGEDSRGVWVHRYTDPEPDSAVYYSLRELELATADDLTQVARYFLNRQYQEHVAIRRSVRVNEERTYEEQVVRASTPDPDAPPCTECNGGLAHYPECSAVTERHVV